MAVVVAVSTHDGCTNLAKAYTVAPTVTSEHEISVSGTRYIEGGAVEMGLTECSPNLEFLTNDERPFRTDNLQPPDASALAAAKGNQVDYIAQVHFQLPADEFSKL